MTAQCVDRHDHIDTSHWGGISHELAPDASAIRTLDVALVLLSVAAIAVCRRYPVPALVVVTATMLAFHVRVHAGVAAAFPVLWVVYLAAWRGYRSVAALASVVFLSGFLAHDISAAPVGQPAQQFVERTSLLLGWFVTSNVAGLVARQQRAYLEQVEQRAAEAERTREEMAMRRAGEERLRIDGLLGPERRRGPRVAGR